MSDLLHGMADHIHHLEKVCPVLKSALINQAEEQLELSHAGSASNSRKPDRYAATAFRARERCSGWCLRLLTGLHLGSLKPAAALDKLNARILSDNYAQQLKKLELIQQRVTAAFDKLKIVEVGCSPSRPTSVYHNKFRNVRGGLHYYRSVQRGYTGIMQSRIGMQLSNFSLGRLGQSHQPQQHM